MRWLRGHRPKKPLNWRATVSDARKRAAAWARETPKLAEGESVFDEKLWTVHKKTFSQRQHVKCAYCEMSIAPDPKGGDIEHYRPKAKLTRLLDDPTTWGEEVEGHNSRDPAKKRRPQLVGRGYWWLAYEWRNYLLACGTCNQKWKETLFPIEGGHLHPPTKASYKKERALLLNPYGNVNPADHLEFTRFGQVSARNGSEIGLQTIRTCHLTRETLRSSREHFAESAWSLVSGLLRELDRPTLDRRGLRRALVRLLNMGLPRKPYSGMVRILWAQRDTHKLTWKDLRQIHLNLTSSHQDPPVR
jgi:hypothetical protein